MPQFRFQLLRYAPNIVSGEFFNIGVLLFDEDGRMIEARFAEDFQRIACHPLAEIDYLRQLREEFEERRLLGEGFSGYVAELSRNLSSSLQLSEPAACRGENHGSEIERLYRAYVATPLRPFAEGGEQSARITRRELRRRMEDAFRRHGLFEAAGRFHAGVEVAYAGPRLRFRFDFAYQPNGERRYVHGMTARNEASEAARICLVLDRLREREAPETDLTVVMGETLAGDTLELLQSSGIATRPLGEIDELAREIRSALKL